MAEEIITSTNADTATDHEYNASEIQVLKGLEAVRKRPGMYIGSTGERGLHHLVYEIVDNAIDEALAGYCDHIEVKILKDNIIQVTDNGRGIPVDIQADTGLPAVTVVYTILHAGGKFGGENSGYKVAGGLHGVGASVVNACSEWLTVNVRRDGKEYEQTFRRGDPDGALKCIGTVAEGVTGTRVTFKPDPEMFKDTTVYDFDTLEKRLREESFLNAGVKITLTDERQLYTPVLEDGQEGDPCYRSEVMCYEGGIKSFVTYLGEKRKLEVLHPNVIYLKGQTDRGVAEIALQYNSSYNELLLSFANNVNTPDGGTHEEGFKASLTRVFNDYGRSHGLLKDKDENLSGADVREGLICVISVKLQEAEFEGQTKAKLGNTEIRTLVSNMVYSKLMEFFEENPGVAKAIFEKATQAARARAQQPRQLFPVPLHPFQHLAAQQTEHSHGAKTELRQNPCIIRSVLPVPHQVFIQQQGQISSRLKHSCRTRTHRGVGKRDEFHHQPVNNQQQPCYRHLPPDGQMKKANGRNQVAGGDGLERIAVQGHFGRFKTQQISLHHHAKQKKRHYPPGNFQVNLPHRLRTDAPGKGKRHGRSHNEQKEGHHQVPGGKPLPIHVRAVLHQPLGAPVIKKVDAGNNQSQPPGQEKHVKSPQGVNGRNPLRLGIGKRTHGDIPTTALCPPTFPKTFFFSGSVKKTAVSGKTCPPRQLRHDAFLHIPFPVFHAMLSPQHDHGERPIRRTRQRPEY